ncbi:hypothetical protein HG537_0E01330 [Torulaspora globosa]|uniref:Uncharacterized protein n=1 Tax=Torulaspora globosa TaxID=48254 RepID=A0A7H9HSS0_9SACH|nr:hypothetical protein HG537_0E01330 [Torulaspora sp. CBS 2947]
MGTQMSPSDMGLLSRSCGEDSDVNEIYYSVQERDTSDSDESFYSVRDQDEDEDVVSMTGGETTVDVRVDLVGERDVLEANMTEIDDECDQIAEERELSNFFNNYHRNSNVKKKSSWSITQDAREIKMNSQAIEFKDASFHKKHSETRFDSSRSPSVMITDVRRPPQGAETKMDDIEIIELDDYIEERDELIDCDIASNDIEIVGPDPSCIPEEPFVEFDGLKKVVIIPSDDEPDDKPDNDKIQPVELTDWLPRREISPEIYEPTTDELQQSPVQRKMKKLIELAQKFEKMPAS